MVPPPIDTETPVAAVAMVADAAVAVATATDNEPVDVTETVAAYVSFGSLTTPVIVILPVGAEMVAAVKKLLLADTVTPLSRVRVPAPATTAFGPMVFAPPSNNASLAVNRTAEVPLK